MMCRLQSAVDGIITRLSYTSCGAQERYRMPNHTNKSRVGRFERPIPGDSSSRVGLYIGEHQFVDL